MVFSLPFLHLSPHCHVQATQWGEVGVGEEEEGEGEVNFASILEVLHGLMALEEIPKGVEVEVVGMDTCAVGVVVWWGNHM